jgi:hypothetical protein
MAELTPGQRTAMTARIVLTTGLIVGLQAVLSGSAAVTLIGSVVLAVGAGLLIVAKQAD